MKKPKKKYQHIAVDDETFQRFRSMKNNTSDTEILKELLNYHEEQRK